MKPTFFASPAKLRAWLDKHHTSKRELWVGFYKTSSGKPSITWPEAVDEALCFGWIDGIRKSVDAESYTIRFTPRKARSVWSAINIERAKQLARLGKMRPAGLQAFERRTDDKSAIYSYEQRHNAELDRDQRAQLADNAKAWAFFQAQPPWYRRAAAHWVTSAKQEQTRVQRLARLIADSAAGRTIPPLTRNPKPRPKRGE